MTKLVAEQVPALVSGSIALFGAVLVVPQVAAVFSVGNLTIGDFGLFLLVSWGVGYSVEAIGLVLEQLFWSPFGGPPATWPARGRWRVLTRAELEAVAARVRERLGVECRELRTLSEGQWASIYRRIYLAAARQGNPKFPALANGYRMSRALAASFLLLSAVLLFGDAYYVRGWMLATLPLAAANLYRMYRSGVRLMEEALLRFLDSEDVGRRTFGWVAPDSTEAAVRQEAIPT